MLEFDDVARGLNEGEGNVVVIFAGANFDIVEVFLGQDVAAEISVGEVEAFAAHDETVVFDFDLDGGV